MLAAHLINAFLYIIWGTLVALITQISLGVQPQFSFNAIAMVESLAWGLAYSFWRARLFHFIGWITPLPVRVLGIDGLGWLTFYILTSLVRSAFISATFLEEPIAPFWEILSYFSSLDILLTIGIGIGLGLFMDGVHLLWKIIRKSIDL